MTMINPFRTPYHRPSKLSNPHEHFSQREVDRVIKMRDDQLTWSDFNMIFHWGTPAGSYEEIVYFLPLALCHIREKPIDALEFMSGVFCFIDSNIQNLASDSLDGKTVVAIEEIFQAWTSRFIVAHYDADACREKGWSLDHEDRVENCQSVMQLIEDLQSFPAFPELSDKLIESLAWQQQYPVRSAWFLEYAREVNDWPGTFIKSSPVQLRLSKDRTLLQDHYNRIVKTVVASTESPTYWPDLCIALGLCDT
jgi:hypothetical protein